VGYEPTTLPQNPIRDCLAPPQGSLRPWGAAPEGASRTPTLGAHLQHTCGLARPSELVRIPRHTWYVSVHEQGPPHARPQASVLCRGGGSLSSRGSHSKGGVGVACGWWLGICYCNRPTSRAGLRDRPTHFLPGLPSARSAAPRRLSGTHRHAHQWRMGRMDPSMQFHATHTARGHPSFKTPSSARAPPAAPLVRGV